MLGKAIPGSDPEEKVARLLPREPVMEIRYAPRKINGNANQEEYVADIIRE